MSSKDKDFQSFEVLTNGKVVRNVNLLSSNGEKIDIDIDENGRVGVHNFNKSANELKTEKTTVGTSSTLINIPENANEFIIFHQDEEGVVFWDNMTDLDVSTSPKLKIGESLEISGEKNISIYGKTTSGSVVVYASALVKG